MRNLEFVSLALSAKRVTPLALFGHGAMSDLSPVIGTKRTSAGRSSLWVHALGNLRISASLPANSVIHIRQTKVHNRGAWHRAAE